MARAPKRKRKVKGQAEVINSVQEQLQNIGIPLNDVVQQQLQHFHQYQQRDEYKQIKENLQIQEQFLTLQQHQPNVRQQQSFGNSNNEAIGNRSHLEGHQEVNVEEHSPPPPLAAAKSPVKPPPKSKSNLVVVRPATPPDDDHHARYTPSPLQQTVEIALLHRESLIRQRDHLHQQYEYATSHKDQIFAQLVRTRDFLSSTQKQLKRAELHCQRASERLDQAEKELRESNELYEKMKLPLPKLPPLAEEGAAARAADLKKQEETQRENVDLWKKHEYATAPLNGKKFVGGKWDLTAKSLYQQYRCRTRGCKKSTRSYCSCMIGNWMCQPCHAMHLISVITGVQTNMQDGMGGVNFGDGAKRKDTINPEEDENVDEDELEDDEDIRGVKSNIEVEALGSLQVPVLENYKNDGEEEDMEHTQEAGHNKEKNSKDHEAFDDSENVSEPEDRMGGNENRVGRVKGHIESKREGDAGNHNHGELAEVEGRDRGAETAGHSSYWHYG